jgi:hypothetical protein
MNGAAHAVGGHRPRVVEESHMPPEDELHLGEEPRMRREAAEQEGAEAECESGNGAVAVGRAASLAEENRDQRHERKKEEEAAHEPILVQALKGPVVDVLGLDGETLGAVLVEPRGDTPGPDSRERVRGQHRAARAPEADAP